MKTRWLKVRQALKREKADALLVWNHEGSGQPATEWLSRFTGTSSVLLISRKTTTPNPFLQKLYTFRIRRRTLKVLRSSTYSLLTLEKRGGISCLLITDSRYTSQAKREAKGFEVIILKQHESAISVLKRLVIKLGLRRILIDGAVSSYSAIEDIKKEVPTVKIISKKHLLQELRIVKDKEEIAILRKAAGIASRAFLRLLPEVKAGVTERSLAARLEALCREEGAEGMSFDTMVASGANSAFPHSKPSDKKLKGGELVLIDWGVLYKGYVSDMTRTVALGRISPRLRKIYETVRKAQELACDKAKAGIGGRALDAICRNYLDKKGLGKYFTYATGHGIGMEIHEMPVVSPRSNHPQPLLTEAVHLSHPKTNAQGLAKLHVFASHLRKGGEEKLPTGAVITCEPGVHIPSVGGVRIEDTLVLTKNGNINLSAGVTKELLIL